VAIAFGENSSLRLNDPFQQLTAFRLAQPVFNSATSAGAKAAQCLGFYL
jgi:hypothetical protein